MASSASFDLSNGSGRGEYEQQLRAMNEALLVASVQQHELAEQARQSEAVAHESEERYRTLFDFVPVAVYACAISGVIQKFNRRAAELWGREPAVGDTEERFCGSFKLFRPDGRFMPHDQCPMAEVLSGKIAEIRDAEVLIERPDGSRKSVVVNIHPVKNQRGEITGAINCFYDITERKQAEERLRQSEARFRAGIEAVSSIVWTNDAQGLMTGEQAAWGKFTGQDRKSYQGYGWSRAIHPDDAQPTIEAWNEAVAAKRSFQFEHRVRRSDGQWRLCSIQAVPVMDDRGEIIEWVGVHSDITERREAEQRVRASEARFRRVFESNVVGMIRWDLDRSLILDANDEFFRMTGYVRDDLINGRLNFRDLTPPEWTARNEEGIRAIRAYGYAPPYEKEYYHKDGSRVPLIIAGTRFDDSPSEGMSLLIDITDRKQAEVELRRLAAELSKADRRKDEFLAMLGHELRNPLAPIINAVQILRIQQNTSGSSPQACEMIERQVGQLVHLVDDLLEVSRISTGRIHLQRKPANLRTIVECSVETVRPLIDQHRHVLAVSLPSASLWIDGDSTRLEQVVVNLLNNAAKYTADGGQIWLNLQQEGNEAVLQVRDSGVGIAPELLPRIFDLFTQAERSLDRSQGGLGIGLCLVQRLVEMHGGQVAVSSVLGQGSEFVVRLPLLQTAEPPSLPTPAQNAPPSGSSLRILIVDDNMDSAMSMAMLLGEFGHDVRTAHEGPTALEVALDFRPDVALLDIGLPGLSGYEVAKWMRQQSILQKSVLVAMTGYGQESDRQLSQAAGFDHHLVKPVKFETVLEILASAPQRAT